jgi:hypothetical protein
LTSQVPLRRPLLRRGLRSMRLRLINKGWHGRCSGA